MDILEKGLQWASCLEVYYYGCEGLFTYYPQLVQRLLALSSVLQSFRRAANSKNLAEILRLFGGVLVGCP